MNRDSAFNFAAHPDMEVEVEIPVAIRCSSRGIGHAVQVLKREMELQFSNSRILDARIVVRRPQAMLHINDAPRAQ